MSHGRPLAQHQHSCSSRECPVGCVVLQSCAGAVPANTLDSWSSIHTIGKVHVFQAELHLCASQSQLYACECRSAPRSQTVRQSSAVFSSSDDKVANLCIQSNDHTQADTGMAIDIELDASRMGDVASDTPLTKSKAISRLAALQVASPGYTPSPVPLRRRLQGRKPAEAAATDGYQDLCNSPEVICIDC